MGKIPIEFKGLFNSLAEVKTPPGRAFSMLNATVDDGTVKGRTGYIDIGQRPGYSASDVCWGMTYGIFACNTVQKLQITGAPTGGTVVLRSPIQGATNSSAIPWDAYPADMQTGILPWTLFDDGELEFTGGPWPNQPIYAVYKGRYADAPQSLLTLQTNSLSGGSSPTLVISNFVTGGPAEGYLVVIQPNGVGTSTLYWVTSSDGFTATTTWTSVGTGLTSSDWKFQQIEDKIYAGNATDGIAWFQLGGSWSGIGGIPGVHAPILAISAAPIRSDGTNSYDFTGATFGNYVGWGSDPTITLINSNRTLKVVLNAALANATVSFDVTLSAASDWSHQDYYLEEMFSTTSEILIDANSFLINLINNDGSPATLTPPFIGNGAEFDAGTASRFQKEFHWGSQDRNLRDNVLKVRFTLNVITGTSGKNFQVQLFRLDTWPNDQMDTLDLQAGATLGAIKYACSYFQASTLLETKLSPAVLSPSVPSASHSDGVHMALTLVGSSQLTTSDFINVYRYDQSGVPRFIGQVANVTGGTTTFTDTNMLDELLNFAEFGNIHLPGGYLPTNMGVWKQSLVVASDRKVWMSKTGFPTVFAPDPENLAATRIFASGAALDDTRARTDYLSLDRSEQCVGIVGQDALYLGGERTTYAMTNGDFPAELSPPRPVPGSRGCVGKGAAYELSGGAMIGSTSGLWYYAVSIAFTGTVNTGTIAEEELSKDVRAQWTTLIGSGASGMLVCEYLEEKYAVNGKSFLKWTRNGQIEYHTLADSMKAAFPTQARGFVWADSTGRLMLMKAVATDNAGAVNFSYATGLLEGPRTLLQNFECHYSGTPHLKVECFDGNQKTGTQEWDLTGPVSNFPMKPGSLVQGWRYRVTVSGVAGRDNVESLALMFEDLPGGKRN